MLYRFTGKKRYLDGAVRIYDSLASGHSDAFHSPAAGKSAWASSMLYAITGDMRYQKNALSQMEFILGVQHPDSYILQEGATSLEDQSLRLSYDWTADLCTWLVECAQELSCTRRGTTGGI